MQSAQRQHSSDDIFLRDSDGACRKYGSDKHECPSDSQRLHRGFECSVVAGDFHAGVEPSTFIGGFQLSFEIGFGGIENDRSPEQGGSRTPPWVGLDASHRSRAHFVSHRTCNATENSTTENGDMAVANRSGQPQGPRHRRPGTCGQARHTGIDRFIENDDRGPLHQSDDRCQASLRQSLGPKMSVPIFHEPDAFLRNSIAAINAIAAVSSHAPDDSVADSDSLAGGIFRNPTLRQCEDTADRFMP